MGRRMAEGAALLVDHVPGLLATVAESLARAVMQDMRRSVKERHCLASVEQLHAGVFTVVQRFRSDLGLYVHLHCLVTDGAFEERGAEVITDASARAITPQTAGR
jgi:hypothetical protein